jgi:hypothetical protein
MTTTDDAMRIAMTWPVVTLTANSNLSSLRINVKSLTRGIEGNLKIILKICENKREKWISI